MLCVQGGFDSFDAEDAERERVEEAAKKAASTKQLAEDAALARSIAAEETGGTRCASPLSPCPSLR